MWVSTIIHSSRFEVWPWEVDQPSHLTKLRITEIQLLMCLPNEYCPKIKNVLKNHINNFHVHKKFNWNLEGHHSFQNIIGHFDWNPNFGSTSQGHNSFIFYDFEVGSNALEILRCLLKMLCWTKFQNLKGNTCDNARHYRSFWVKCIKRQKKSNFKCP